MSERFWALWRGEKSLAPVGNRLLGPCASRSTVPAHPDWTVIARRQLASDRTLFRRQSLTTVLVTSFSSYMSNSLFPLRLSYPNISFTGSRPTFKILPLREETTFNLHSSSEERCSVSWVAVFVLSLAVLLRGTYLFKQ